MASLKSAADALRALILSLERNPDMLIRGKQPDAKLGCGTQMRAIRLIGLCRVARPGGVQPEPRGAARAALRAGRRRGCRRARRHARDLGDIAVGMRRLQLAAYLESPSVVVRRGDRAQELDLSEFHRWSEPLG